MDFTGIKHRIIKRIWLLKAMIVSQLSAWADFGMSFAAFAWIGLDASYSAAIGAVTGGAVNCTLNYRWTFRAGSCPVANVAVKYALVWIGSLLLNTYGTELLNNMFQSNTVLDSWGVARNLRFTVARLSVSLLASVFWNLLLQKVFVYRNVAFDRTLNRLIHRPAR